MRYLVYLLALVLVVAAGYVFLVARVYRASARRDAAVASLLRPVVDAIERGQAPAAGDIATLSQNPLTRNRLYDVLAAAGRSDAFPHEQRNPEAFACSDLCYWLAHPHELGAAPDELELLARFERGSRDQEAAEFFVFRFRAHPPHWAAARGWIAGIAGPYALGQPPATMARRTFSRFESADARTPEGHLDECLKSTGG
jgi:diadenosine tetraphosphatase ApaH/serine/threonine PP2A family protein phosphatase